MRILSTTYLGCSWRSLRWAITLIALSGHLIAQQSQLAPPNNDGMSDPGQSSSLAATNSVSDDASLRNALTASQIDTILQQKPEVVIELKSFVSDQLQQQGVNTQADSITDEMLFNQIATRPDLRASITLWMRARGYASSADLHRSFSDSENDDDGGALRPGPTLDSLSQIPGTTLSSANASAMLPSTANPAASAGISSSLQGKQGGSVKQARNITDDPEVLRLPTPYNLQSLRDLYTQIPQNTIKLKRFGSDMFINRDSSLLSRNGLGQGNLPIDLPVGPDYILGPGDGITINLWGGISQSLTRVIDREGKVVLPEVGSLVIAGLTLQHAQITIANALKQQFRNAQIDITIARLRTVRVYVVGDVQRPGAYELSSLSTPLNALYAAGGPTGIGSLRTMHHLRGKQIIRDIDLYDFLLHGLRMDDDRFESGDTLLVPPAGPQVAIGGMVKRPAIYEVRSSSSLAELLEDAGGTTVMAALNHVTIERIQANQQRETISLDPPAGGDPQSTSEVIARFNVKDGDRIQVAPILPYSERAIYVEGHVVRPGKYPYKDGMQLSAVLGTYKDLLPEPAMHGEIIRLAAPDLHPETMQFDLAEVLIGNNNVLLQPFDTIRIFGRYEVDSPQVTIRGEVLRPGAYALSQGMTSAQLVKMAGGFKRDALLDSADLTSYTIQDEKKIVSQRLSVRIGEALKAEYQRDDVALKAGDVLTIHQISGWNDIGTSVTLEGEVTYPGSYGLQEGERLSSVLRRAGEFRGTAYPSGAVLIRTQVRDLEEKSRAELIRQIESTSAASRISPSLTAQDQSSTLQAVAAQQAEVLQRLKSQPASGRLVIHVGTDIKSWENTDADIEMRSGDVLTVPKRPGFVLVSGQVYNSSAITFVPGKVAGWYLRRAGGSNDVADRKDIFVIRANGSVVGRRSGGWYGTNVIGTRLEPGDVVVVPQRILGGSLFWRNLLTVAQISSSIAITAAVAGII
ncbi:SLBB domain-containing protein [Granulicella arctica]|uniref:SLBB domain-containing protein n=1 Tax=Granulicella arctica TaxID=940613 RepID=UPI0021E0FC5B|nr:SLBB domain-containing protein [Granulicella arctica]